MVYINIQDTAPVVYIPRNGHTIVQARPPMVRLQLRNTTDGTELKFTPLNATAAGFLERLRLSALDGIYPGEWQYGLTYQGDTIATGLLVAYDGDKEEAVEYTGEVNTIQYEG